MTVQKTDLDDFVVASAIEQCVERKSLSSSQLDLVSKQFIEEYESRLERIKQKWNRYIALKTQKNS